MNALDIDRSLRLILELVTGKILEKEEHWFSFISFATTIMKAKEVEGWLRERASPPLPLNSGSS